ncbi:MAG TPA: PA14 domain-containing protein, partial [Chryseosolibacter sp.]|nr:PA14 domain-containing protein [Chryseosolibacter sp.]
MLKSFRVPVTLLAVALCSVLTVSCDRGPESKRPKDPWVFRSVLDQKPRMVTALLHENLYVAYDARACQLYKAWKGDVIFDGAVYTTNHGPQPTSKGYAYYTQPEGATFWYFTTANNDSEAIPHFRGYFFKDDQVTFNYEIESEDGRRIRVQETPEHVTDDSKTGLRRVFRTYDMPGRANLKVKTTLTNLQNDKDYRTNGELKILNRREKKLANGSVYEVDVELILSRDQETTLEVYYHPGFDTEEPEKAPEQPADALAQGRSLIDGSDCKTCHNETVKTVGPSYVDVAKKYEHTEANLRMLVAKVIKGGSGNWGAVPMTAHPDLTEADAGKMVSYIMSLDGEKLSAPEDTDVDLSAATAPVGFEFDPGNKFEKEEAGKTYPGVAVSIYKIERRDISFYDYPKHVDPVFTAVAPAIHFSDELFEKHPDMHDNTIFHVRGFVNIENDDNYVFRLVSDDGARLWLDNKLLIDNDGMHGPQARDGEIMLKKGKHPIEILHYQGLGGLALSLQWAKHGDTKFSVIQGGALGHDRTHFKKSVPYVPLAKLVKNVPGDQRDEAGVHPSFEVAQARPSSFEPKVGGLDFLSDGTLLVCTWDSLGPVYRLDGVTGADPEAITVTRIASGLAEPLGIKVVNDTIYVLQKQELTRLIDNDKDGIIDEYQTVCDGWRVSANFHEFAFGLAYKDGYFYAALATAINPGGASTKPQIPDRGKVVKISKTDGSFEFIASGLRTPNGINFGVDGE